MPGGFNLAGDQALDQVLVRRLLMPGGGVAATVAPELMPGIVLESDRPEYGYLRGESRYGYGGNVSAGGAGIRSSCSLMNVTTNMLVVLQSICLVTASGSVQIRVRRQSPGTTIVGANDPGISLDTRAQGNVNNMRPSAANVNRNSTLASSAIGLVSLQPSGFEYSQPIMLGPGGWVTVQPDSDNVAITSFYFSWRERPLNPSEL